MYFSVTSWRSNKQTNMIWSICHICLSLCFKNRYEFQIQLKTTLEYNF
jgi:hypothetical protein